MEPEVRKVPRGFIDSAQDQLFSARGVQIVLGLAALLVVGTGQLFGITAGAAQVVLRRRLGMTIPAAEQAIRPRELADEQRALREEIQALRRMLDGAGNDAGR